ncbi:ProP effector [Marinomonas gallaica]|uniref:ProP effector n=1 Tax=Marinomonas gallaica TaxID=1806667 RepID=A0A1C3JPL2_9GAMM|nr:ProQ/FINO family protein [Marinomonas gallaica]SBT17158.1 ProP effector [Marinomonas gallaica]SBT19493.1 ProP effector [Marinomonas gallaica]
MDRLIKALEGKIDDLVNQLELAKLEIEQLKEHTHSNESSAPSDASLDLLSSMSQRRSTEEQLQLYIEDSLDLLNPVESEADEPETDNNQTTLNFDLLHSALEDQPTEDIQETKDSPMTTEQQTTITADIQETAATEVEHTETTSTPSETPETASLSAEEKRRQKNQKNNRRLIKMLEDRYPKAFDWNNPRPLKVGIDKDMTLDEEFNASKQKRAMAAYTRSDRYKKCLQSGQPRIDLEGIAVSDEPALPNTKKPTSAPEAKKPMPKHNKGKRPQDNKPQANKSKGKANPRSSNKERNQPKQDPQFDNLSPEERMKAKLALLTNKS